MKLTKTQLKQIIKEELEALMREPDVTQSDAERIASELYNNHRRTGEEITHDTIGDAAFEHGEPGGEMATQDLEVEIATALKDLGYLMPEDEPVPALEEEIPEKAPESAAWKRRKAAVARQKIVMYLVSNGVYEKHAHLPNWIDVRSGHANVAERKLRAAVEAGTLRVTPEDVNSFMQKLQREIR